MIPRVKQSFIGAVAGLLATLPMTVVMIVGKRLLPQQNQNLLPAAQITKNALRPINVDDEASRVQEKVSTSISHFGFNAGAGAIYGTMWASQSVANDQSRMNKF